MYNLPVLQCGNSANIVQVQLANTEGFGKFTVCMLLLLFLNLHEHFLFPTRQDKTRIVSLR